MDKPVKIRGNKFRIYPKVDQKKLIDATMEASRQSYNMGLTIREESYKNGTSIGYEQTAGALTKMKKTPEYEWMQEVDSVALQQALRDLDRGYTDYFAGRSKSPHYKPIKPAASYRTVNQRNRIRIEGNTIRIPKIGYIKIKQTREIGRIQFATIERTASGKYYVALNEEFIPEERPNAGGEVGLDVGIKNYIMDQDGNVITNPQYLEKSLKKLKKEQRRLSKQLKGSKNWEKQRMRVAKICEQIGNQRKDYQHKITTELIKQNQVICVEDLNVRHLVHKNYKGVARGISDASWAKLVEQLQYKSEWYNNEVIKVPRYFASSQTCSVCGFKNTAVKGHRIDFWTCPKCGTYHDRDRNAAINILRRGLEIKADST